MNASAVSEPGLPRWQRWLLPAVLGVERVERGPEGGTDLPRSVRDWLVDVVFFGFAVLVGIGGTWGVHREAGTVLLVIGGVLGVPSCLSLWVRRRHPLAVGWLTVALSTISPASAGAAVVAIFTVAVRCSPRRTLQVAALSIVTSAICAGVYHGQHYDYGSLAFGIVVTIAMVGLGWFVRVRRELVLSLQERALRAEGEQSLRAREAQLAERARIAREMHDVLAHRISLLSVHAGALEFNPEATPEEIAQAAGVIRVSARAAQEELREVIGVLRDGAGPDDVEPPQPTIGDLNRLVEESRAAGMDVSLKSGVDDEALAPILGRTVYRVVQEALTNARKHAPGQVVTITVDGDRSAGVQIAVVNRPWVGQAVSAGAAGAADAAGAAADSEHVGSGMGLVGLTERITLVGGQLLTESLPGGGFRLRATLPWSIGGAEDEGEAPA